VVKLGVSSKEQQLPQEKARQVGKNVEDDAWRYLCCLCFLMGEEYKHTDCADCTFSLLAAGCYTRGFNFFIHYSFGQCPLACCGSLAVFRPLHEEG